MKRTIVPLAIAGGLLAGPPLFAGPLPQVHALTGARIVVAPGEIIDNGTVVVRDGLIESVGSEIETPPDARTWELEGKTVYAGLIEPYAVRSWPEEAIEAEEKAAGLHQNSLVRPLRQMALYGLEAAQVSRLRGAGFTTALAAPGDGLFRGTSALLNLGDGTLGENLLEAEVAHHAAFEVNSRDDGYPASLMGSVALFRQTLSDAAWYSRASASSRDVGPRSRPTWSSASVALGDVAAGRQRLVLESGDLFGTLRVAELAQEMSLVALVVGNGREYQRLDAVAATGLPHLLPLELPEAPATAGEGDPNVELDDLRHWDEAPGNPARMMSTGLEVAFTAHGLSNPRQLHASLASAIERGLSSDEALRAFTVTPAKLLGIDRIAGTVEAGKLANLVVAEGDLFTADTSITAVWIDGRHYEVEVTEPPEVEPAGTWEIVVLTGDGEEIQAELVFTGAAAELSGSIGAMGAAVELGRVTVSADTVELSFDGTPFGFPGSISMELTIEGEALKGSGQAPIGPFAVTGRRIGGPTPEVIS